MLKLVSVAFVLCSSMQCLLLSAERHFNDPPIVNDATEEHLISQILGRLQENEKETKTLKDEMAIENQKLTEELVSQKHEIKVLNEKIDMMRKSACHDEPNTLPETKPAYQGKPFTRGEMTRSIRESDGGTPVAFYAEMVEHLMHAGINQTLIFDNVVTNTGNGYHAHTGIFNAPYDGIYIFSVTILSFKNVSANYNIYLDNINECNIYVDGATTNSYESASKTIALYVRQNQSVMVRNENADRHTFGGYHTSFTGFLLHNYGESGAIIGK